MSSRRSIVRTLAVGPWFLSFGVARSAVRARVGLSLPLKGVQATVAQELLAGYQLSAAAARQAGIELDLLVENDDSKPLKTAELIQKFGLDPTVVATTGIVGTDHAKAAIPGARTAGLPVVGLRSGASELRDGRAGVYHLRASYEAEIDRMVAMLGTADSRVSVVASEDSFGVPLARYLQKKAAERGIRVVRVVPTERYGSGIRDAIHLATNPDDRASALVILMITKPAIEGVRAARDAAFLAPIFTMSFTAGRELVNAGPGVFRGLGLVTAFPVARAAHDETSNAFRRAAVMASRLDLVESVTAAEGFWYGATLARAIAKCGDRVTREGLVHALETTPAVRVGGEPLRFDDARVGRQFLQVLYVARDGTLRA